MRLHRFIRNVDLPTSLGERVTVVDAELAHQIANVLRLTPHDHIILADNKESEVEIELLTIDTQEGIVTGTVVEFGENKKAQATVHLYVAMPKRDLFETIVAMTTQLGVTSITPIVCERTVKVGVHLERTERIAREAAETAGRNAMPIVNDIISFSDALTQAKGTKILFDGGGEKISTHENLETYSLFIGPEGGFTQQEIEEAKTHSAIIASLGNLTLRIETAAVAAVALTQLQ